MSPSLDMLGKRTTGSVHDPDAGSGMRERALTIRIDDKKGGLNVHSNDNNDRV